MIPARLLATTFVAVSLAASPAHAGPLMGPPSGDAGSSQSSDKSWYGYQLIAADALSFGAFYWGASSDRDNVMYAGMAGFALAAPATHLSHGNHKRAAWSFGLRVGLPTAAVLLSSGPSGSDSGPGNLLGLLAVATITSAVIDDALLAWKAKRSPRRALSPNVIFRTDRSGGLLGVSSVW